MAPKGWKKKAAPKKKVVYVPKKHTHTKKLPAPKRLTTKNKAPPKMSPKKKTSSVRSLYDLDKDMNADLNALQIGTNKGGAKQPPNHAAATTKITCGVMGIATAAAVGLYLYKKRSFTTTKKRKNTEQEHAESAPDPMEIV